MRVPDTDDDPLEAALRWDAPVAVQQWLGAPALSYPVRPPTVLDALDRAVRRWPSTVALQEPGGRRVSWAGFADLVQGAADRLIGAGLHPGDAVAVAAPNGLEMAVILLACARARLVMVGLNTRLQPPQWAYMVEHSAARLALTAPKFRAGLAEAARAAGLEAAAVQELELAAPVPWSLPPEERPAEASTYAVVYTSGTTGRPKASQVVHRCSVHSGMSYQKVLRLCPGDRTAVFFPLYYISAMHAHVIPAMLAGATCVLVDTSSPREFVRILAEERIVWAYAVPSWWTLATRDARLSAVDLPDLRVLAAGGSPFPAPLVQALRERLPGVRLIDIYGLSETHSPATMLLDKEFAEHPGSTGRTLPCMEIEIRGADGEPLGPGQVGEIWLRGSLVTTGYAGDPEATAAAIVAGWFDSGDVGRMDGEGFLYVLDRTKDMINRGGNKVFSAEVEAVLRDHPDIADAAVVGAADRLAGEAVAAFVVVRAGAELSAAQVRGWVRRRMADYATPSIVHVVAELPRNPVGKTDKLALRARLSG